VAARHLSCAPLVSSLALPAKLHASRSSHHRAFHFLFHCIAAHHRTSALLAEERRLHGAAVSVRRRAWCFLVPSRRGASSLSHDISAGAVSDDSVSTGRLGNGCSSSATSLAAGGGIAASIISRRASAQKHSAAYGTRMCTHIFIELRARDASKHSCRVRAKRW